MVFFFSIAEVKVFLLFFGIAEIWVWVMGEMGVRMYTPNGELVFGSFFYSSFIRKSIFLGFY